MIIVGVDPGARSTGLVAIDTRTEVLRPGLLAHTTVARSTREPLLEVSPEYLRRVTTAVAELVSTHDAGALAIEGVTRPRQHLGGARARGGKGGAAADPTAIMATAVVLGALLGRAWGVPGRCQLVVVPPARHGQHEHAAYPPSIAGRPGGKGHDAARHERSAFDVARSAPSALRLLAVRGSLYVGHG